MSGLTLVKPLCGEKDKTERLDSIIGGCLKGYEYDVISTPEEFEKKDLKGRRVLFAVSLGESGINLEHYKILKIIRNDKYCLEGAVGAVITDGRSEFHTKAAARELVLSANTAGCAFIGKSLVEGTGTLKNYNVVAKNMSSGNLEAYAASAKLLVKRLMEFEPHIKKTPRILMIHASNGEKSNTKMLWDMVRDDLSGVSVEEISLQDGEINDCIGCPYTTCLHFGEKNSCFYGGVITEKVYPAIITCNTLVIVSPNYNDAAGAYITAFINRLTALLRVNQLTEKQFFAVIVSGYSGGDLVAEQLIGALNMNKPFILPPRFALFATANGPGEIRQIQGIEETAHEFANKMLK